MRKKTIKKNKDGSTTTTITRGSNNRTKTKVKVTDPNHYKKTLMTGVVYGGKGSAIKKSKTVTKKNKRRTKVRKTTYSPIDYYGKQLKKTTKTKKKN